jgi:8-hydroxy-5-deazaflavin:NADPH oxidoreductase
MTGQSAQTVTIAILGGTGQEGGGLALRFAKAGHRVILGSRSAARAAARAAEMNARLGREAVSGADNKAAAAAAEIVILTVPYAAQRATVEEVRDALSGKILIDATVPLMPPKVSRVQLPPGGSAAAAIQALLGDAVRVVSAFQNVSAHHLNDLDHDVDCDVLVCGDDAAARETVIGLAAAIGLTAWHAGPLVNSAAAEALTSVMIFINRHYKSPGSGIRVTGVSAPAQPRAT